MLEIILLIILILLGGLINPAISILLITILIGPSIYAMLTGAPFVPTPKSKAKQMLKFANIKPGDIVYDLGCGDGRLLLEADKAGAQKMIGYELSPLTFLLARMRTLTKPKIKIRYANFWKQNVSEANIVFVFLMKDTMATFKKVIWPQLKPGTRVVSHVFELPGIKPQKTEKGVKLYVK